MSQSQFSLEVLIKEKHVDSLGHMNNSTYLELMEEARWDYISQNGYGHAEIQKYQQGPVILEVNLKFMNEIRLREKVYVTVSEAKSISLKVAQLKQQIIKENGIVAAEALFTFGLFDLQKRKLIEATDLWKKALQL